MKYSYSDVRLEHVQEPVKDCTGTPVALTDETMAERKEAVLRKMKEMNLDALVVYADLEHGSNFEYLVGFLPRFEESLLVLHENGKAYLVLGNENLNKASKSRIEAEPVLASYFSLPNQPMQNEESFADILKKTGIEGKRVGIAGWKNFTSRYEDNSQMYDLPYFIMDALQQLCGKENLVNACRIFIGGDGVRTYNNPNEIAHYEFAAALASDCMLDAMDYLEEGVTEMDTADKLVRYGQRTSIVTIAAFGPRFIKANMYPTRKKLEKGDTISLTIGYKGGSSSRSAVAAETPADLPEGIQDYFEKVCAPYFTSIQAWLEQIHTGMKGGEMYNLINEVLPKKTYGWKLCPGHTTSDEEWMSSPIYEGSEEILHSGTLFQTDIIPSVSGYPGVSMESTCLLADQALKEQIEKQYPEMYQRMLARRDYIVNVIGIHLSDEILPMCNTLAYMRPLALSDQAAVVRR